MKEQKHKVGLKAAKRIIVFEIASHFKKYLPYSYFKMLSLVLSELVLISNFFEETYFCYLRAYLVACFYEIHLRFLKSHIYFDFVDCDKLYQSLTREMDDGADMRFKNSLAARNPSRFT